MISVVGNVSTKGQVTLPAKMREKLGIKPGDRVAFVIEDDAIVVRRSRSTLRDAYQSVPALKNPVSLEEMKRIAAADAADEFARQNVGMT